MACDSPAEGQTCVAQRDEVTLVGEWDEAPSPSAGWATTQAGATLEVDLSGDFVRWIGPAGPQGGVAEVEIVGPDGRLEGPATMVDAHADRDHQGQTLFARYQLPPGPHRIRIRVLPGADESRSVAVERIEWGTALRGPRYIDARDRSVADDAAPGTSPQTAWRTFANLRGATLGPGCHIRLARGSTWSETLGPVHGAGLAEQPIVIEAYGAGDRPHIAMARAPQDRALWLNDPDHVAVRDLEISGAGAGIVAYYSTTGHRDLRFEDLYTHDNDVIHWYDSRDWVPQPDLPGMYHGAAILITGRVPVSDDASAVDGVVFKGVRSERDSDPIDISGFNPRSGNLEFLGTDLGTHAVRRVLIRDCDFRDGKGGLNFDNVEDLTMVSTRIAGMCRVPQVIGTTGLFFWSVDRVVVVNSLLCDVPDTGSVDGTGCDLEAYTRRVRFLSTSFARNAGSGLEYLAIEVGGRPVRPGDHCIDHEVMGCAFSDNVRKHRDDRPSEQLGSIHLRNDTDAPFSGRVDGCFYAERYPLIHVAGEKLIPDWHDVENMAVPLEELYSSADQFDRGATERPWVGERADEDGRVVLPQDARSSTRRGDGPWLTRFESVVPETQGTWCSRTWIAPRSGMVAVRSHIVMDATVASSIIARVTQNGEVIRSMDDVEQQTVTGLRVGRLYLDGVAVRAGDRLGFEVSPTADGAATPPSSVSWAPLIAYVDGV